MQPTWMIANAWREIILRAFDAFKRMENYSPEWLINPETNRHLKLDYFFPEIKLAVRLEGLKAKDRKSRLSLEEEEQERIRGEARTKQCEKNGIALITIDVLADEPKAVFKNFEVKLSWATRMALQAASPDEEKMNLEGRLRNCRSIMNGISWKVRRQEDLSIYAEVILRAKKF